MTKFNCLDIKREYDNLGCDRNQTGAFAKTMKPPAFFKNFSQVFSSRGFQCFLVGGAVRDLILKRPVEDYDIATDATPHDVRKMFRRVIPTGIKHGTVTVLYREHKIEVTTFRIDGQYSDRRRPDDVKFSSDIREDLKRRDFTINGIAYDLLGGRLLDPHGGREDLKAGRIKAIGEPAKRFDEDSLRVLRGCRFAAQLGFRIEDKTMEAIKSHSGNISVVSSERIRDEFLKITQSENLIYGFQLLDESGILRQIIPELSACKGTPPGAGLDVFEHSLLAAAASERDDISLRLAALFHDLGKPLTFTAGDNGEIHFHNHERESARLTEQIMTRLRMPNALIQKVTGLVIPGVTARSDDSSGELDKRILAI